MIMGMKIQVKLTHHEHYNENKNSHKMPQK